jgi:hypothetical protein
MFFFTGEISSTTYSISRKLLGGYRATTQAIPAHKGRRELPHLAAGSPI